LPSIAGFDDLYNNSFNSFRELTNKIGPDVKTIVDLVDKLFKYERSFLIEAARSLQPAQDVLMKFYQQFSKQIEEVQSFREKNRTSQFFNHLSAISESIGAFGWISVQPAPSPFVKEMSDSAQFYTNRVLKDYKEK
jgi:adenylyl cyclase-associated protein